MPVRKLPRANDTQPVILSGEVWNYTADSIEQSGRIYFAPPLFAQDTPAGVLVSVIPGGKQGLIPVNVSDDGTGSGGDATTGASFKYNVTDALTGDSLGTSMSPVWARLPGKLTAATHGTGYTDATGNFVLYQVDEVPVSNSCSTS